jgi:cell division protein FtsX
MISLGLRLAVRGGHEARVRLLFTALGVGLGVALLCFTLAGFNGLKAKDVREGWYSTSAHNRIPSVDESRTDALWWALSATRFRGEAIVRADVAALGGSSPAPPGLTRAPAAGEYSVSPSLARLLESTPADELGQRFPGRRAGIIAESALSSPESLVVIVGRAPGEVSTLPGAEKVRSIEAAPRQHSYSGFLKIVLGLGAAGLLIPVLVFVATSTRLAAARREERYAAFRLVGATPHQVNRLASVEAGVAAAAGTAMGFALFWAFRPAVARIPFTGEPFFTSDLSLGWKAVLGIVLGVPLAAVLVSLWSLRRVRISPLGVTRRVTPKPPRARRVALLIAALAALGLSRFASGDDTLMQWAIITCFTLIAVGIIVAGPWLTLAGGRLLARLARRDATLIAGRRLSDDPGRAFRAISGLVLAVFVGTVFVGVVGTAISSQNVINPTLLPKSVVAANLGETDTSGAGDSRDESAASLTDEETAALSAALAGVRGARAVVPVYASPAGAGDDDAGLIRGSDWSRLGVPGAAAVRGPVVQVRTWELLMGDPAPRRASPSAIPSGGLDTLHVRMLLVTNDGRPATLERVRTAIESAAPGSTPISVGEVNEEGLAMIAMLQRMVDVGIVLCLVIAGCSLAVSVAGGLIERKRPFSLLRLTGMPLSHLRRIVMLEAVVPLLVVAVISAAAGLLASHLILGSLEGDVALAMPGASYWAIMAAGLLGALGIVATTLPLLTRLTEPQSARME